MAGYALRPQTPDAAAALARATGVTPATAQVLLHRGLETDGAVREFLSPRLADLTSPETMVDRLAAAERLTRAIRARERIAVFGDYDVDGTTSAVILSGILAALGGEVATLVANRFEGGYGLSHAALRRCLDTGATVLVTCDCGSSDHERIAAARRAGVDVIVVDHHLVPEEPLPALAFLNPHRPDCGFGYKGLASAGLALSLGAAVRAEIGGAADLRDWLDLVALGTIADVAPLDGDNRRLVRAGLERLGATGARPAVVALRELSRLRPGTVGAADVAFRFAPRLNAAGRLGDPTRTLELLKATTLAEARALAAQIEALNTERKRITKDVSDAAVRQVETVYGTAPAHGVVAAAEGWHRGVVGIVAARLVDRFRVPALVVAFDGGVGHGSGRAPEGVSLYDVLDRCRAELEGFGGHAAAVGLTVRPDRLDGLRAAFASGTSRALGGDVRAEVDVLVGRGGYDELPSARELAALEPVGEANAEPLFAFAGARIERAFPVGAERAHLKLELRIGDRAVSGFGYELGHRAAGLPRELDLVGCLRPDGWRGGESVELRLHSLGPWDAARA